MSKRITSAGYHIDFITEEVSYQNSSTKVRPKTFELLALLLNRQGEVVSKEEILKTVWSDVVVDEQVIFQSINELRKIFAQAQVIKTYPRKGYTWLAPVEVLNETLSADSLSTEINSNHQKKKHIPLANKSKKNVAILVGLSIIIFVLLLKNSFFSQSQTTLQLTEQASTIAGNHKNTMISEGSVIILPVKNVLTDADHLWVRYGAMDQLIQRLSSSETIAILQTDDVMDIMKRADLSVSKYSRSQINKMFLVSGATLVVESTLTGVPGEYQIIYTLHQKRDVSKGVLFDGNISSGIAQLANVIGNELGIATKLDGDEYRSGFANHMVATALEFAQSGDHVSAAKFLDTAITTEPENVVAKRLLAKSYITQNSEEQYLHLAQNILKQAIVQAKAKDNIGELARLNFWQAVNELNLGNKELALESLAQAEYHATNVNDWLYRGYLSSVKGKIHQHLQEFDVAKQHFNHAIKYQQVLRCPYGEVQGLLDLAELALVQNDFQLAMKNTEQALTSIKERQLSRLKVVAEQRLQQINQAIKNQ